MDPFSSSPGLRGQQSLQTRYAGCWFRSRLEARWAIVFDLCKIEWAYEPQIFDFPDGTSYLPDFRLPHLWVEVKGHLPMSEQDAHKVAMFERSGRRIKVVSDLDPIKPEHARALAHRF